MGRWAQQRKRGGHLGAEPGLPAGPVFGSWEIQDLTLSLAVVWTDDAGHFYDFWRSRWRAPAVSMLWTLSSDAAAATATDEQQASPLSRFPGQQQDCELAYCTVDGTLLSGWSGYQSLTP